ncbi:unnamed protein product [Timema podura]|uniref:RING-type domain-containing protein n=1 Tax=Timema podura TaxID=61482 RepID=A0ABN7NJR4_TIMPD|nr:unnamed protein product [Timema podura]
MHSARITGRGTSHMQGQEASCPVRVKAFATRANKKSQIHELPNSTRRLFLLTRVDPGPVVLLGDVPTNTTPPERYKKPVISVCCWHVHCEECWLHTLGAKKLCPQCNMITSPSDLRRIYM